ncbi:MAG: hypothetical protein JWL90_706 [Chthoniobacteraceae bacterium]|nr:hypothetical protein [Chthoniobacteraceae bacterium]
MDLPKQLFYSTSARIGGSGLDAVAKETVRVAYHAGILGKALAFENRQNDVPAALIRSLERHPVRLISWFFGREFYYGAKKHALDKEAVRELKRGSFDLFHGWSGESVRSLRETKQRGIPSLIEIPTWHRHKGKSKPVRLTKSERERAETRGLEGFKNRFLITRQQMLEEYELADLILVLSEKAEETFLAAGVAKEKLFRHQRGVDVERFVPAEKAPEIFRAVFVGALIERKGVHHLLRAWHRLNLRDAELLLVGSVHEEIKPWLREFGGPTVKIAGFVSKVEECYQSAAVHLFPSSCEGSAKSTYEAAACGLPQITTRESGDVVIDRENGLIIPPEDSDAIAEALRQLHANRDLCLQLGAAGRRRVVENFTWEHFGRRLLEAYRVAMSRR